MPLSREQFCWLGYFDESLDIFKAIGSNEGHNDLVIAFRNRFNDASAYFKVLKKEKGVLCWAGIGYVLC